MATNSPNKGYVLPATGDFTNTWGVQLDTNVFSIVDLNMGGRLAKSVTVADVVLTSTEARNVYIGLTGVLTGNRALEFPTSNGGFYIINNGCTGAFTITAKPTGGTGIVLPQGQVSFIFINPDATTAVFAANPTTAATGVVPVSGGGTGSTTAAAAATALGLGTGDSPQFTAVNIGAASDTTLSRASAGNLNVEGNLIYRAGGTDVPVADGGTGSSTAAGAATNLGLGTGNSPQFTGIELGAASDTTLTRASAGVMAVEGKNVYMVGGADVAVADGGTGSSTASGARTNLGLGTMAVVDSPVPIANGGTASTTASAARTALGLGTAAVEATGTSGHALPFLDGSNTFGDLVTLQFDMTSGSSTGMRFRHTNVPIAAYIAFFTSTNTQVGSISCPSPGTTAYNTSSDKRLKDVVGPITDSGEVIDALEPVYFRWKEAPEQGVFSGLLAQDAYAVRTELAHPGDEDLSDPDATPWSTEKAAPMAYVLAELRALRKRVAELEGRFNGS